MYLAQREMLATCQRADFSYELVEQKWKFFADEILIHVYRNIVPLVLTRYKSNDHNIMDILFALFVPKLIFSFLILEIEDKYLRIYNNSHPI